MSVTGNFNTSTETYDIVRFNGEDYIEVGTRYFKLSDSIYYDAVNEAIKSK